MYRYVRPRARAPFGECFVQEKESKNDPQPPSLRDHPICYFHVETKFKVLYHDNTERTDTDHFNVKGADIWRY